MNDSRPSSIMDLVVSAERLSSTQSNASGVPEDTTEQGRCRIARRPQMMVAFRRCNGVVTVLPYSSLSRIQSDDSDSVLQLNFPAVEVRIEGERLTRLFHYLCEHRVLEIAESDRAECMNDSTQIAVSRIDLEPLR